MLANVYFFHLGSIWMRGMKMCFTFMTEKFYWTIRFVLTRSPKHLRHFMTSALCDFRAVARKCAHVETLIICALAQSAGTETATFRYCLPVSNNWCPVRQQNFTSTCPETRPLSTLFNRNCVVLRGNARKRFGFGFSFWFKLLLLFRSCCKWRLRGTVGCSTANITG